MAGKTLTLRVSAALSRKLERLARKTKRSKSLLATEAISNYVELGTWHIAQIEKGLAEARSGAPGVPHAAVQRWVRSWGTDKELPRPKP